MGLRVSSGHQTAARLELEALSHADCQIVWSAGQAGSDSHRRLIVAKSGVDCASDRRRGGVCRQIVDGRQYAPVEPRSVLPRLDDSFLTVFGVVDQASLNGGHQTRVPAK